MNIFFLYKNNVIRKLNKAKRRSIHSAIPCKKWIEKKGGGRG
jgi:hypothetical protein